MRLHDKYLRVQSLTSTPFTTGVVGTQSKTTLRSRREAMEIDAILDTAFTLLHTDHPAALTELKVRSWLHE